MRLYSWMHITQVYLGIHLHWLKQCEAHKDWFLVKLHLNPAAVRHFKWIFFFHCCVSLLANH